MNNTLQKFFFAGTSELTRLFPRAGARLLDGTVRSFVGMDLLADHFTRKNRRILSKVKKFDRFLIHPDIHIGDSIMGQSVASAIRDFFPDAEIHFVANATAAPLLQGHPEIDRVVPLYRGGVFPSDLEIAQLRKFVSDGNYDLCFNFCPFVSGKKFGKTSLPVLDFITYAPRIMQTEGLVDKVNHFAYQYYEFVHEALGDLRKPVKREPYEGLRATISQKAESEAAEFVTALDVNRSIVFVNPDASCPYTCTPFARQVELVRRLLDLDATLFIGEGHTYAGIGSKLIDTVPSEHRHRVFLVPAKTSLDTYSALIDRCDLFITGDTGPMHIAAARKFSEVENRPLRNRTAILSLFGATPIRMSGYDSLQSGFVPANQDAPSWSVASESPCRNITCVNKLHKTCKRIRCFERLDLDGVLQAARAHLGAQPQN